MEMRKARFQATTIAWTFLVCTLFPLDAQAVDGLNYSLQLSLEHSDNVAETSVDAVSESILIPRLNFAWTETGSALQANATGEIEYRNYLGGKFDNEVRGQVAGVATWIISPERFTFDFADYAGVSPVNVFATNAPGNQQQTNVFSLGPTFLFRFGSELRGEADLRATDSSASVSKAFNSQRVLGALRAIRDLSPTDQLSGNVEVGDIHFRDDGAGPDYDRYSAYARYQAKRAALDFDVSLGYSLIDFSHASTDSGLFAHAKGTWHWTAESAFEIEVSRQYSDATQDLVVEPAQLAATAAGPRILVGNVPINSDVYIEERVDLAYVYRSGRLEMRVAPFYRNLNYVLEPGVAQAQNGATDQTAHGAVIELGYHPRPLWTIAFNAGEETRKYTRINRHDEDLRYGLNVTNQFSRQWSLRLDLIRNQRSSTTPGQGFGENLAMLSVIFRR
ncbi:MAG: hypothetical protein ABI846_04890 [Rudaea sp.]